MAVSAPALHGALADIVGREHLLTGAAPLAAVAVEGVVPRFRARPASPDEVSRLLALAAAEALAVAPRGSGSSTALGNRPRRLDLVVDLARLDAVTDYVPEDMVATAQAGVTLGALAARAAPRGQRLALDPPGGRTRTVGGVLATHASGPLRFRYGTGRDLLLGARFVQADGVLTWGGSRVVKSVSGYDVPKLLVGSLGTLGVIVEATLRLHPTPPVTASWRIDWPSRERAEAFLSALLASPIEPERLVLLGASAAARCGWPAEGPVGLVAIGSVEEAVATQGEALTALAAREGGRPAPVALGAWEALDCALGGPVVLKLACEIRRTAAWLGRVEALAARVALDAAVVGQAGNGVLHVALGDAGPAARELVDALRGELAGEGGSAVVERAPEPFKATCDVWGPIAPAAFAIMERLKREFDPAGLLNPGRFVGGL